MGGRWEVLAWLPKEPFTRDDPDFHDVEVYRGNSFIEMLKAAYRAKYKMNSGCVSILWR